MAEKLERGNKDTLPRILFASRQGGGSVSVRKTERERQREKEIC